MAFRRENNRSRRRVKNNIFVAVSTLGLVLGAGGLSLTMAGSASADSSTNLYGCSFEESATVWTLQSNCNSTHEIDVPAGITLDGDDYSISPNFAYISNPSHFNNAVVGVLTSNDVTIQNVTIDGTHNTNLHGINVYQSNGISINRVTVKNMGFTGINVNGSVVSVSKVTTANNVWDGIDVDKGTLTFPAVLNIVGPMTQTDIRQIYVDDTRKIVTVNDFLHQYSVSHPLGTDALYTLFPTDKQTCKDGGWKLGLSATQSFKNQGKCVSHFESGDGNSSANEND